MRLWLIDEFKVRNIPTITSLFYSFQGKCNCEPMCYVFSRGHTCFNVCLVFSCQKHVPRIIPVWQWNNIELLCRYHKLICQVKQSHIHVTLKRNKSHGLGAMHLKETMKTNHVQLKSRISRQRFTQNVI